MHWRPGLGWRLWSYRREQEELIKICDWLNRQGEGKGQSQGQLSDCSLSNGLKGGAICLDREGEANLREEEKLYVWFLLFWVLLICMWDIQAETVWKAVVWTYLEPGRQIWLLFPWESWDCSGKENCKSSEPWTESPEGHEHWKTSREREANKADREAVGSEVEDKWGHGHKWAHMFAKPMQGFLIRPQAPRFPTAEVLLDTECSLALPTTCPFHPFQTSLVENIVLWPATSSHAGKSRALSI